MKCLFCGGSVIYHPGNSKEPGEYRCIHCSRNPQREQPKIGNDSLTKKRVSRRNYPELGSEIER
jgi:hypothetical protein